MMDGHMRRGAVLLTCLLGVFASRSPLAIGQVKDMLNNIVAMVETESKTDEQAHTNFDTWSKSEKAAVQAEIGSLQASSESVSATLADLKSQRTTLTNEVNGLRGDLERENSQIAQATERRQTEKTVYVNEQQDFDNAIQACNQAATLLGSHYGGGTSLTQKVNKYMKTARDIANKIKASHKLTALLQRGGADPYKESTAEAVNIVDQVRELGETFAEDKQSAVEQEDGLQRAFTLLVTQKTELTGTLTSQLDTQQSQLSEVTQGIAENEGAFQMASERLQDQQKYLSIVSAQHTAATNAYDSRKNYRTAEVQAVRDALGVLDGVSLAQRGSSIKSGHVRSSRTKNSIEVSSERQGLQHLVLGESAAGRKALARIQRRANQRGQIAHHLRGHLACKNCEKAGAMLRQKAATMHSELLTNAAAAMVATNGQTLDDVIQGLEDLEANLNSEEKSEREHKTWCEAEQGRTATRRSTHASAVEDIQQTINSLSELVSMKNNAIKQSTSEITNAEKSFTELSDIRGTDKDEFTEDLQDCEDAVTALNEAIQVLSKFYASSKALLQGKAKTDPRSGSQVIEMMTKVRGEFESAARDLKKDEGSAVSDFSEARDSHTATLGDFQHNRDVVTVEQQTATQSLQQHRLDLQSNSQEVSAADGYLARLSSSCKPLIDNFDQRRRLRRDEKGAITDAIKVLREA